MQSWHISGSSAVAVASMLILAMPAVAEASPLDDLADEVGLKPQLTEGESYPLELVEVAIEDPTSGEFTTMTDLACGWDVGATASNAEHLHRETYTFTGSHSTPSWSPAVTIDEIINHCRTPRDTSGKRDTIYLWKMNQAISNGYTTCSAFETSDHLTWEWDGQGEPDEAEWTQKLVVRPITGHELVKATPETTLYHASGTINLHIEVSVAKSGGSVTASVDWPFSYGGTKWWQGVQGLSERSWTGSKGQCERTVIFQYEIAEYHAACDVLNTKYRFESRGVHWTGWNVGHWHTWFGGTDSSMLTVSHSDPSPSGHAC